MPSTSPAELRSAAEAEFHRRMARDLPLLRGHFGVRASTLEDVTDVRFCAGDPHRGGRTVTIVGFADDTRVVYKPRSLDAECHLNALVEWFNDQGPTHTLRRSHVLAREGYGWCAYVDHTPCPDTAGLRRFYWRCGAWLALFHLVGGYDMHDENLIADGEHPTFVDVEALLRGEVDGAADSSDDVVDSVLRASPLAVGLLPQCLIEIDDGDEQGSEVSGLAGGHGPNTPVTGDDGPAAALRHAGEVTAGFEEAYRLLREGRARLLADDGPLQAFAGDEIRQVLRHTSVYRSLRDGYAGTGDAAAVAAELSTAPSPFEVVARHPAVLAAEQRQLERGDIPVFHTVADGTALLDETGVVLPDFLPRSGLAAARARLDSFCAADLRRQTWFVKASFATLAGHLGERPGHLGEPPASRHVPRPGRPRDGAVADPGLLLDAAVRVGDQLLDAVVKDRAGTVEWPAVQPIGSRFWVVGPSGLGLGSGVSGIALFLAELASASGLARFSHGAQDVVSAVADPDDIPEPEQLLGMAPGAYQDLGGLVHVLARIGTAWRQSALLDVAGKLVPAVLLNLADDAALDVSGGAAGAVLVLSELAAADPAGPAAGALPEAAELLLTRVRQVLGDMPQETLTPLPETDGYAYGGPGVAHALTVVGALTDDPRTGPAAERLLLRSRGGPATWCHGSAGTLLARTGIARAAGGPADKALHEAAMSGLDQDIGRVRTALDAGLGDDSLCHGSLGLAEALLTAGSLTGDEELTARAQRTVAGVARAALEGELDCGVPLGTWTPGLLSGAAGIGHGILRALAPDRVPSVLLLEP